MNDNSICHVLPYSTAGLQPNLAACAEHGRSTDSAQSIRTCVCVYVCVCTPRVPQEEASRLKAGTAKHAAFTVLRGLSLSEAQGGLSVADIIDRATKQGVKTDWVANASRNVSGVSKAVCVRVCVSVCVLVKKE